MTTYSEDPLAYSREYYQSHADKAVATTKVCRTCGAEKPAGEYYRHANMADGLMADCAECVKGRRNSGYVPRSVAPPAGMKPWQEIIAGVRYRSKKEGIPCDIDSKWAKETYTGKCSLTGLDLVRNHTGKSGHHPLSPSLDRIEAGKGYVRGNLRWVCMGVNALRGIGDDETMYKIALALVLKRIQAQTKTAP